MAEHMCSCMEKDLGAEIREIEIHTFIVIEVWKQNQKRIKPPITVDSSWLGNVQPNKIFVHPFKCRPHEISLSLPPHSCTLCLKWVQLKRWQAALSMTNPGKVELIFQKWSDKMGGKKAEKDAVIIWFGGDVACALPTRDPFCWGPASTILTPTSREAKNF